MKIGFDVSQTGNNKAGCGYFADSLICALTQKDRDNEYLLYPHFGTSFWDPDTKNKAPINKPGITRIAVGNTSEESRAFWTNFPSNGEEILKNPDIIHANNFYCPQSIQKARIVYTLYDLSFAIHPEFTTEENRWICFEGVFNASCYADFVLAISDYSRNSFLEMFPHYPADRIRVVHLGSRFSGNQEQQGSVIKGLIPDKFWLSVGTLEPRKNLRRLLKTYAALIDTNEDILPLVLAGGAGWLERNLDEFIRELGIEKYVRILGYVTDEQLAWLYKNCFVFIYPSIFEGFGLPVLEALSMGAAVATSNLTSLPEVAGENACYFNPLDEQDILESMRKLLKNNNFRNSLKESSTYQAMKFSWDICATEVLDIYQQVMRWPKL